MVWHENSFRLEVLVQSHSSYFWENAQEVVGSWKSWGNHQEGSWKFGTIKRGQDTHIEAVDIVCTIMKTWTSEITNIVQERKKDKIETKFEVSDLLRAKVMFKSLDYLKMAVEAVDNLCKEKKYPIIEMDNRLTKK